MTAHFKIFAVFLLLATLEFSDVGAEAKNVIPAGIINVDAGISYQTHDRFYGNNGQTISGKDYLAHRYHLDEDAVSGDYVYTVTDTYLNITTGVYPAYAIELSVVGTAISVTGDVSYDGTNDTVNGDYLSRFHLSGESSGIKQFGAMILWEPYFSRTTSVLMGLGYTHNNAEQNFDNPKKPYVGSGIDYLDGLLQMLFYSREIPYRVMLQVSVSNPQNTASVKLPDKTNVDYKKNQQYNIQLENEYKTGNWSVWGNLNFLSEGHSTIRDDALDDGSKDWTLGVGLFYGNYFKFISEKGNGDEYKLGLKYIRSFLGFNTPMTGKLELSVGYLF